jgi:hypothetical protein
MIRYPVPRLEIESRIDAIDARWFEKAAERTNRFVRNKRFEDSSPIWSVIKPAFMAIQNNKCIFCERQLETGPIEHDLEHFRPKSAVKLWPNSSHGFDYQFATGKESAAGYYWLAYDIENYAASCKQCNSPLKSNYFPIAGRRQSRPVAVAKLSKENAFLCYPIGEASEDPEGLVTFMATTAVPVARSGVKHRRGRVIIDFFELNKREQLHRERARMLVILGDALARYEAAQDDLDRRLIESSLASNIPHAGCLRAFRKLWDRDRLTAKKAVVACKEFLISNNLAKIAL